MIRKFLFAAVLVIPAFVNASSSGSEPQICDDDDPTPVVYPCNKVCNAPGATEETVCDCPCSTDRRVTSTTCDRWNGITGCWYF